MPDAHIEQILNTGFITASSLCESLGITGQSLGAYFRYLTFYGQLMLIDPDLPKIGYVYLIIFENTFKIGRTENFDRRYDVKTRDKALKIQAVSNHYDVERELIAAYRSAGYVLDHGREYFRLDNVHHVQTIFNKVVKGKEICSYDWRNSQMIKGYLINTTSPRFSMSPKVGMIIVNRFARTEDQRRKFNQFLELIDKQISNGYFDQIYDNQNQSTCSYWQYFNFVAIRRWKDDKVNVSRLFNTIRKNTSKMSHHSVSEIVRGIAENKNLKEAFEKYYPGKTMMEYCENREQPYLSGYYLDMVLVPTFVSRASPEASIGINQLLLYLGSEAFVGSSVDEAKTQLQLHKYLSERKLIHDEIAYGLMDDE